MRIRCRSTGSAGRRRRAFFLHSFYVFCLRFCPPIDFTIAGPGMRKTAGRRASPIGTRSRSRPQRCRLLNDSAGALAGRGRDRSSRTLWISLFVAGRALPTIDNKGAVAARFRFAGAGASHGKISDISRQRCNFSTRGGAPHGFDVQTGEMVRCRVLR